MFPAVRLTGCFAELNGLVLLDPARLDEFMGGHAEGHDLLHLFTTTDAGDRVSEQGIAIPVLGVEAGYYTVLVRHVEDPSPWTDARLSSDGWVLGTHTGSLLLGGAGYLTRWATDYPALRPVTVPPGWYAVEIRGYRPPDDSNDDGIYEFILTPTAARPAFRADLDRRLGLATPDTPSA